MTRNPPRPDQVTIAAWILTAIALTAVLLVHLVPALFAGLLVFELVHLASPYLERNLSNDRAKLVVVGLLAVVVVALVSALAFAVVVFVQSDPEGPATLLSQFADVVLRARAALPAWLADFLPSDQDGVNATLAGWLKGHAGDLGVAGRDVGRALVYAILGMVVGAMLALRHELGHQPLGPLAAALATRATNLGNAFRSVVFAQVRISLINTAFTAVYLLVLLPAFGIDLPLRKTLIAITFVAGLLPVVGNLISNTFIVVTSLSVSGEVALASLAYLVIIHKLEYFLNARIIGSRIRARAWELLVAILVMEATFGIAGVVAAPIYYAFLKDELAARGLV